MRAKMRSRSSRLFARKLQLQLAVIGEQMVVKAVVATHVTDWLIVYCEQSRPKDRPAWGTPSYTQVLNHQKSGRQWRRTEDALYTRTHTRARVCTYNYISRTRNNTVPILYKDSIGKRTKGSFGKCVSLRKAPPATRSRWYRKEPSLP